MYRKRVTYRCKRWNERVILKTIGKPALTADYSAIHSRHGLGTRGVSIEPDETIYYLLKLGKRFNLFSAAPARYATVTVIFFFQSHACKVNSKMSVYAFRFNAAALPFSTSFMVMCSCKCRLLETEIFHKPMTD